MKERGKYLAGSTKKVIDDSKDPYLSVKSPDSMALCTHCNSVYYNKRWVMAEDFAVFSSGFTTVDMAETLCPACHKISDGFVGGYVTLEGKLLMSRKEEVLNTIKNKELRMMHINPLAKVMSVIEDEDKVVIATTTPKLAQSIGRQLHRSFKCDVDYKFGSGDDITRVYCHD